MIIKICIGGSCGMKGSSEVVHKLGELVSLYNLGDLVEFHGSFCIGNCAQGVCVLIDDQLFSLNLENTEQIFYDNILSQLKSQNVSYHL